MPEQTTTPDYSSAPRKRGEAVVLSGLPGTPIVFLNPSVLYLTVTTTDGTCNISFTTWDGSVMVDVPIFQQGKFDFWLIKSIQDVAGVSAMWRAW